jgi:hypothetical protein
MQTVFFPIDSSCTIGTNFTVGTAGIVTAPGNRFSVGIKTGDIVTYNRTGFSIQLLTELVLFLLMDPLLLLSHLEM